MKILVVINLASVICSLSNFPRQTSFLFSKSFIHTFFFRKALTAFFERTIFLLSCNHESSAVGLRLRPARMHRATILSSLHVLPPCDFFPSPFSSIWTFVRVCVCKYLLITVTLPYLLIYPHSIIIYSAIKLSQTKVMQTLTSHTKTHKLITHFAVHLLITWDVLSSAFAFAFALRLCSALLPPFFCR